MKNNKLEKQFAKIGTRVKVTKWSRGGAIARVGVSKDNSGEYFSIILHPDITEDEVTYNITDTDAKLKQMIFVVSHPVFRTKVNRRFDRSLEFITAVIQNVIR